MITSTISGIELVAMVFSLVTLFLVLYSLSLSLGDNARVKARKNFVRNSPLHLQSKVRIRAEARKVATALIWLCVSLVYMSTPGGGRYNEPETLLLVTAILATLGMMAADTFLYLLDRNHIEQLLESESVTPPPTSVVKISEGETTGTLQVPVKIERE